MIDILKKCELADFIYLSELLDTIWSFTNDKGRKELLNIYQNNPSDENKLNLANKINEQIRYYGSSDIAFLIRVVRGVDGSVSTQELIQDVADKLKVKIKMVGSVESQLERLVKAVVEKEFMNKSPEELADYFRKMNLSPDDFDFILKEILKIGPIAAIPIIIKFLGEKVALQIIEAIIVGIIGSVIGRAAAQQLAKELLKRNPVLNVLGPIAWVASGIWLGIDLQGTAYRKTIPSCLYLGIVGLRNGPEDGEKFWETNE